MLGLVISDAMYKCLLNDAVIGAEMMKITAIKAIMYSRTWLIFCGSTPRGTIHSVEERRCRRRELEMDDIGINMDYFLRPEIVVQKKVSRESSGICPKRHAILVELNEPEISMYNIKSGRKSLNAHSSLLS